jgi:hypothetical protein
MGKKTDTSKPAAITAPAAKKPAAKKTAAKSPASGAKKAAVAKTAFTQQDIALRAYFISEKRQKAGLPGDAHHDWIQAERQLIAESKKKPAAKSA